MGSGRYVLVVVVTMGVSVWYLVPCCETACLMVGLSSGRAFSIDLTDGEFCDFDDDSGSPVSILDVESRFVHGQESGGKKGPRK